MNDRVPVPSVAHALLQELGALDAVARDLTADLPLIPVAAGAVLFSPGASCEGFALVLSGAIDVRVVGETGREIRLYRVVRGETCIQTTLCLLGDEVYSAEGVVAEDAQLVLIPRARFETLINDSPLFRAFVFRAFAARMNGITRLLEEVAFLPLERRLAMHLMELAGDDGIVPATHQALANGIGSAREVISRQLDKLSARGIVQVDRGKVRLLDKAALERLSRGAH